MISWLKKIGKVRAFSAGEVDHSRVGIGFEKLDRAVFDPEKAYDKVAALGVKWTRIQSGWQRTETEKGVYHFEWLDDIVDNLNTIEKFNDKTNYSFRKYSLVDGEEAACYKRAYLAATRLASSFQKESAAQLDTMLEGFDKADNTFKWGVVIFFIFLINFANIVYK